MNKFEKQTILIFSFRYALGRMSTAPSTVVDILIDEWDELTDSIKQQIKQDIRQAIEMGNAGMECDVKQWERILEL